MRLTDTSREREQNVSLNDEYKEQLALLKDDREKCVIENQNLRIQLDQEKRTSHALVSELDKWKDEANISHEKNKSMNPFMDFFFNYYFFLFLYFYF